MGRQALHPSSPAATSALAVASSEEEGLHTRPLPHTYGEYFCVVAVFIGGGRLAHSLPPHNGEEFSGGGGTGPPSHISGVYIGGRDRPSSSQRRCVRQLHVGCAVQVVRGQDQAGLLTVGTLRRYHPSGLVYVLHTTPCCGCVEQSCLLELGCRRSGRHRRHLPSGSEWGYYTDEALRQHHGLWDVLCLAHGCRSRPLGTLCDTMRWVCWLFVGSPGWSAGGRDAFGDTIRPGRCAPEVCWTFRAAKCFTCLREASGASLLTFGLLLVWFEQVGDGCGSDPGGTASYLAHIKNVGRHPGRSPQTSHSAQRHTMQGKTTEWFTCMGGAARC